MEIPKLKKGAPQKPDRKTVEKNRRIYLKSLYFRLENLLPSSAKDGSTMSTPDCLTDATKYITELRARVENLRERKRQCLTLHSNSSTPTKRSPCIKVREISDGIKAVNINGNSMNKKVGFYNTTLSLEEEGIEILSAHTSVFESEELAYDMHFLLSMQTDCNLLNVLNNVV